MRIGIGVVALAALALAALFALGSGVLGEAWHAGVPQAPPVPAALVEARGQAQLRAAREAGIARPRQILFGDLHVHSTFSTDAFMMSLGLSGGDGARPVSDACDFARVCSALDFWSINDHALALTQRRWDETVEAIRACNDVAGDPASPDVTAFLGWEWTQVGTTPQNHYGHKNVILRHTDEGRVPARPIAATLRGGAAQRDRPSRLALGLLPLVEGRDGIDMVQYFDEMLAAPDCPDDARRDAPDECYVRAATPGELFSLLDEWGHEAMVIPHGTTWGYYTPGGSSWDKQLSPAQHDPARQTLIEIYSGHGNSEEYRDFSAVQFAADGSASCPEPSADYLPSCWRAGEIIQERCLLAGESEQECEARAAEARRHYVAGDVTGHLTVPGDSASEWGDAGQCRDCFQPSFNYRPRSSVQYIMALSRPGAGGEPLRFRFGFLASSDNHSARPGTGYKEYARSEMTELRFASFGSGLLGRRDTREPLPRSEPPGATSPMQFFGVLETERQGSFFLTGGLVAAHAEGRSRDAVWQALSRREVYGTSGPRILLWFDLVNPPGGGAPRPMGSEVEMAEAPVFAVRAVGSFEQLPGCPEHVGAALSPEEIHRLCRGECYNPSDRRRRIARIEIVKITPQQSPGEPVRALVRDPWRRFVCQPDPAGCRVAFTDPDFAKDGRDALYYARAVEEPSPAVDYDGVRCLGVPLEDDCLGATEPRAWSSPIFVDWGGPAAGAAAAPPPEGT